MNHCTLTSKLSVTSSPIRLIFATIRLISFFTLASVFLFFVPVAQAAQTTLTWTPPVNTDGTPVTGVTGYKLHIGTASGSYSQTIDVGNVTSYSLNNLSDGTTYYFTATDYDDSGNESGYSNEVSKSFPARYTLTATSEVGGTITPVGTVTSSQATSGTTTITSVTVDQGTTQSFYITPNAGFATASVAIDGASIGTVPNYSFINVAANHTIAATFSALTYTITATTGTGGSITPTGASTVTYGGVKTYSIAPAAGYAIADVKVDGASVGAVASYSFVNVTANHSITASFTTLNTATLTWDAPTNPDGTTITDIIGYKLYYGTSSGNYSTIIDVGNQTSYTINNLSAGTYYFVVTDYNSTGDESSFSNEVTKTISGTVTTYTITATAGTGGSISPTGSTTVANGSNQIYTISPASGYNIADVKIDGLSVGASSSYTFTNVTANHTITATFAPKTYAITGTAGTGGTISPTGTSTVNNGGSQTYTITPASGYTIADVKVDGTSVGTVTSYTFTNITTNHTISATFSINTYTITAATGTGGSITPAGTTIVTYGNSNAFTIVPATGYAIADVKIDGTSIGTVTSYTFSNVTANHTITATFTPNTSLFLPVRIAGRPSTYQTLQSAYNASTDGAVIQMQAVNITETLYTTGNISVVLAGGYTSDFTSKTGYTVVEGSLIISDGSILLDRIIIK